MTNANSGTCSLFLLSSIRAASLRFGSRSSATQMKTLRFSSLIPPSITDTAPGKEPSPPIAPAPAPWAGFPPPGLEAMAMRL